jgi:hypothetical protein
MTLGFNMSSPDNCGARVVPNRFWKNKVTGRVASCYGANPSGGGWELTYENYTIQWPDGTVGVIPMGRGPFKTEQEAADCIAANPNFPGFQQD